MATVSIILSELQIFNLVAVDTRAVRAAKGTGEEKMIAEGQL